MTTPPLPEPSAYAPQMVTEDAYTADQLRAYGDARAAEARATHAKELVEAHREAFVGNIQAVSKLGLDAMDVPPLLLTPDEVEQLTGYRQASRQLKALHLLGYFRARLSPRTGGVLLERAHYHAVAEGRTAAPGEVTRPRPRVRQPSHA